MSYGNIFGLAERMFSLRRAQPAGWLSKDFSATARMGLASRSNPFGLIYLGKFLNFNDIETSNLKKELQSHSVTFFLFE